MLLLFLSIIYTSTFELGYTPEDKMSVYVANFWDEVSSNNMTFYSDLEAKIWIKNFYLGGGFKAFAAKSKVSDGFNPYKITYRFLIGYKANNFEIGFRHYCVHPVVPWITFDNTILFGGAYEELYIRFEGNK